MLTVIGAGLPRTGTTSTKAALERLGFGPCYHMFEIMTNPDHADRWLPVAADPTTVDWGHVFAGYRSTQDWPASHFWRELADTYPEAKVLLTVRDADTWFPSLRRLLTEGPGSVVDRETGAPPAGPAATMFKLRPLLTMIGQAYFGTDWSPGEDLIDRDAVVAAYHRHIETVRAAVPADRLLVFDVRQGWEPLCEFLAVPVPDEPFPRLNDAEWMARALERMRVEGRMPSPFEN
jgi:hypothetical protein